MEVLDHEHTNAGLVRALPALVLAALAAVALTSCGGSSASSCGKDASGLPNCSVTASAVASHPEASLAFPGSTVVSHNVQDQQNFIGQTNAANADTVFATSAPMATVYAWYSTWLTQHGWHGSDVPALGPIEISTQGYARGSRERFVVAEDSLKLAQAIRRPIPASVRSETLYETTYFINPPSGG